MIRYLYNRQFTPPAPLIHVTLRCPISGTEIANLPAQLDTAADRTVIPANYVAQLAIVRVRELSIEGLGRNVRLMPTYVIQVGIHDYPPKAIEALADNDEPFVLLGRDILNQYRILLDGPKLALEIE